MDPFDLIMSVGHELPLTKSTFMPSCKSINEPVAGIFIATENMEMAEWDANYMEIGVDHFLKTQKEDPNTNKLVTIGGRLIVKPRLLIVRSSPYLKMNADTGYVEGLWNVNTDKTLKEQGIAYCVKRYVLYFVGDDGKKMHKKPIQLTAKGNFMYHFNKQYTEFIAHMLSTYNQSRKEKINEKINLTASGDSLDLFFCANCIFEPYFESQIVGTIGKKSNACITTGFYRPVKGENLISTDDEYLSVFKEHNDWYKKAYQKTLKQSDEIVVFEEVDP